MSNEIFSPRRVESTTPRKLNSTITSNLGVNNFLKELDKIQEQQVTYTKKLEKYKRRKYELDEKMEVRILFLCLLLCLFVCFQLTFSLILFLFELTT